MDISQSRWRKTSDVDRKYSLFELISGDITLLDVGYSDDEIFEIAFHDQIKNSVFIWEEFSRVISQGKKLADEDK